MHLLASLAKDTEVAQSVWQSLESACLVDSSTQGRAGLAVELESVETRNEEYPLTRAFLHLLDVLTETGIPSSLGTGFRSPGFEPYLQFVRDLIFLHFSTRTYKNPGERWQVASQCLKLFTKFLANYSPAASDFSNEDSTCRHPGYWLMLDLFRSSELLRILLYILDEGCSMLDVYQPFPGKPHLER